MQASSVKVKRQQSAKWQVVPPRWPLAWELASLGTPIGVALVHVGGGLVAVVVIDTEGEIFELKRLPLALSVRWCLNRHLRVHRSLGELSDKLCSGHVLGWLHGRVRERIGVSMIERTVYPVLFVCVLPGEPAIVGAVEVDGADVWGDDDADEVDEA